MYLHLNVIIKNWKLRDSKLYKFSYIIRICEFSPCNSFGISILKNRKLEALSALLLQNRKKLLDLRSPCFTTLFIIGGSETRPSVERSSFRMIHRTLESCVETSIGSGNAGRMLRAFADLCRWRTLALSKSMESSKAGIKFSQNGGTYRADDGCYEFGKHQTRGERWLNDNRKDRAFMRGSGVTGISPGWSRQAPQDIYDARVNNSLYISVYL